MTDLERCIETARVYRDELFSCNPHPEERGVKLGISDQVAEEVLLRLAIVDDDPDEDEYGSTFHTEEEYEAWEREWHPEWSEPSPPLPSPRNQQQD